jgi:hypothetical protein
MMNKANATNIFELERYYKATTGRYMNDTEKQLMTNLNDLLIVCSTGRPCNSSSFKWTWHPSLYNCYRYNADEEALMRSMLTTTSGAAPAPAPAPAAGAGGDDKWSAAVTALRGMGLPIPPDVARLLEKHAGFLPRVVDELLGTDDAGK